MLMQILAESQNMFDVRHRIKNMDKLNLSTNNIGKLKLTCYQDNNTFNGQLKYFFLNDTNAS